MHDHANSSGTGNKELGAGVPPQQSPPPRRRLRRRFAFLLLILSLLEGLAWIADGGFDFRGKLLAGLSLMRVVNNPIAAQTDESLPFPKYQIPARPHRDPVLPNQPYSIGGRVIQQAYPSTALQFLQPKDVVKDSEKRIFIVGSSAAYGFPYRYADTFAGMLDNRLPKDGYRVINTSAVGLTSGELVAMVRRIIDHYAPDTLILFTGNNEWIHWNLDNQSSISDFSQSVLRIVSHSRAVSTVAYWTIKSSSRGRESSREANAFAIHQELTGVSYALSHPAERARLDPRQWIVTKQAYLDTFQDNLQAMIEYANAANVRIIVMTMPFNYRLSPAWKHPQPESFDARHEQDLSQQVKQAVRLMRNERYEESLQALDEALVLDQLPPVLHYLKAECHAVLGQHTEAENAFAECREQMIGNLGSRLSVNRCIREAAVANGAVLVDLEKVFDENQHAQQRYYNEDLIHDDCHPTPQGHRIIASELIPLIVDSPNSP